MRSLSPLFLFAAVAVRAEGDAADAGGAPVALQDVVVSAAPFERDQSQLVSATNVLSGQPLALKMKPTLGETLSDLPGISSTYFGPGASRPVIRGLGEDRIRILENGIGTLDASVISPDHAVSLDPLLIDRVEVIRGPATLLYGGNAIGGVVNVVDSRIYHRTLDRPFTARGQARFSSVDDGTAYTALAEGAQNGLSWHVDGYRHRTEDMHIPGYAWTDALRATDPSGAVSGYLPNSSTDTDGGAIGASYAGTRGFVGASFSGHNAVYGVPPAPNSDEGAVLIDLRQRRLDLQGELSDPLPGFKTAKLKAGISHYRHQELDNGVPGTTFRNRGYESRLELVQEPLERLEGAVGFQTSRSNFSVAGDEAFLPPSITSNYGVFAFEEYKAKPVTYQLGARLDRQTLRLTDASGTERNGNGVSVSGGAVWTISEGWLLTGSLSRSERQPNVQELFANGPHTGTDAFEIGSPSLSSERSIAAEVAVRRTAGLLTGELSVYSHRFTGYIYPDATGVDDPVHGLQIYRYLQTDVAFYGAELQLVLHLHQSREHNLDLKGSADFVHAEIRESGEPLPRIPPRRATLGLEYRHEGWTAGVEVQGVDRARRLAPGETPTDSYALLNANVAYEFERANVSYEIFVRGDNLTDELARNHVSFLKDIAPLPGRNVSVGVTLAY